jgi:hypothetical protein
MIRENPGKYNFITAEFNTAENVEKIARVTGISRDEVEIISVKRYYNGKYSVTFSKYNYDRCVNASFIQNLLDKAILDIGELEPREQENNFKHSILETLTKTRISLSSKKTVSVIEVERIIEIQSLIPLNF